ncbi:unnamed protein product [Ranitomeya imitator]|uniref:Reverse transcriptase domain-containing protein n=1 Tax=Ranitomeya imitator TaxID=111125 RepID=A0ABN9M4R2_9NEOB|nr:unnamed protein product [Ranitomeya imitator]
MERFLKLAPILYPKKIRIFQLEWRLFNRGNPTTVFSKKPQGRGPPNRPTRRSRRKQNDNPVPGRPPNLVINISSHLLAPAELSLLQKGLSFCPTSGWNAFQLEKDLQRFYRSIRLKTHFALSPGNRDQTTSQLGGTARSDISITTLGLRVPSQFQPPRSHHATETFIELVDREIKLLSHEHRLGFYPSHPNLSRSEKVALRSLRDNKQIIIKPADKGGAIVVMDRTSYSQEIHRQLSDQETYAIIQRDPTTIVRSKINGVITHYLDRNIIDKKTATFLSNLHPITPVFYVLPKIHKSLVNPPGRPIVASTDSILSPLSILLEKVLTPLVKTTRSFLLDTGHFIRVIKDLGTIPPESWLVTLDVNSLYTSISHDKGMEATRSLLSTSDLSDGSIQFCMDLLQIVLHENFFLYEDTFYVQKRGTAMGSHVAPAYANAFMNKFETDYVFENNLFLQYARTYYRYIDDIFLVWTGTLDSLKEFHEHLNSIVSELKFTIQYNMREISFLDTLVLKNTKGLLTLDLYSKPTDCNSLLHYSSCHPRTTKDSLPRSQFTRIARIVTDPDIRNTRLDGMVNKFKERQYPTRLLEKEKNRANAPSSPVSPSRQTQRVPFVHTYHPCMPKRFMSKDPVGPKRHFLRF